MPEQHGRARRVLPAVLLSLAILVTGCGSSSPETNDGNFVAGDGSITRLTPAERGKAPEIAGRDLDGDAMSISQWRGKAVVVNVWGSWCPPCRKETPVLNKLATELKTQDVEFVGIAVRESAASSKAFATAKKVPYPSISDPGGTVLLRFAESLPAVAVPTTYVLDKQGRVATRLLDTATYTTLKNLIQEIAKEPADG